jgi:hypothetical protein
MSESDPDFSQDKAFRGTSKLAATSTTCAILGILAIVVISFSCKQLESSGLAIPTTVIGLSVLVVFLVTR